LKPAAFHYHAPTRTAELLDLLEEHGDDGKLLAGGQSLVPAMNFRLARPAHVVDLNGVAELDFRTATADHLIIGALQRHAAFERPVVNGALGELLSTVQPCIGHAPIRERGTFAGSLAHADPSSEWCLVAATLDADIVACSGAGERHIAAAQFFQGTFATALRSDEFIREVRLPRLDDSYRFGFAEFARRAGDFALAMALVVVRLDGRMVREARVGVGGVADRPCRIGAAETMLTGGPVDAPLAAQAAEVAAAACAATGDLHGDAEYRRDLVRAMMRRALSQALPQ